MFKRLRLALGLLLVSFALSGCLATTSGSGNIFNGTIGVFGTSAKDFHLRAFRDGAIQARLRYALERAKDYQELSFNNGQGIWGEVEITDTRDERGQGGNLCRWFKVQINWVESEYRNGYIDRYDQRDYVYGFACRRANGTWPIQQYWE